ncbi:sushi-repeat-containing protein SRPX-like isoform X1 [Acipenser ruthenus]|uniref:sushi-repeat-containing protein SRPX-like isoform X1 n=1 Tax=Acipenser ruthenus TaxID=7906 RepID=UPI00274031E0|nr:sushi-repeat-containing protein SRPX-like isoform X1 [Acipenser ruthenus]
MDTWLKLVLFVALHLSSTDGYDGGSGYTALEDDEDFHVRIHEEDPWCAPIKVKNGQARCRTPRGEYYKNVMGSRCNIHCNKGYEMQGHPEVLCMLSKRWSGNYACREIRCPKLTLPANGGIKCSDGSYFNSRCEFFCSPGYQLKGERFVTCMSSKAWTGKHTSCVDVEPPTIKCPSVKEKTAEPETLTARVYWETPEGRDTADGILTDVTLKGMPPGSYFPEGDHRIQYTVFDRAGNKGTCKFAVKVRVRRCGRLHPPENGYMKCSSDGDNYGATCAFSCMGGFELQGSTARVCQYGLTWAGTEPSCAPMNINVAVRSAAALLDQFYEKRRLLIVSAPSAANHNYRFQMGILQQAQCGVDMRHITIIELVGVYPAQIGRIRHRLIPPGLALQLRLLLQISHTSYTMVLIDKHGMDKERYAFPVTAAELFTLIDTFPLRKEEMKVQAEAGQTCN